MKPISPNSSPSFNSPPHMAAAAACPSSNNQKLNSRAIIEDDFFMGALLSPPKSGVELMQNCDLPPPTKLYSGPDQTAMSRAFNYMGKEDKEDQETRTDFEFNSFYETEKLKIFNVLRLSQTRARGAEKKAEDLLKEKEMIYNGFLRESMQLLAHRHWVRLLEIQLWKMQEQQESKKNSNSDGEKNGKDCEDIDGFSWFAALAICLGIAFGCRYLF